MSRSDFPADDKITARQRIKFFKPILYCVRCGKRLSYLSTSKKYCGKQHKLDAQYEQKYNQRH